MTATKSIFACLMSGFFAFVAPISGNLFSLVAIFFINFAFGLVASVVIKHERFSFQKAFRAISESAVFLMIVLIVLMIGKTMTGAFDSALQFISFITYTAFYFYGVNILRNAHALLPKSKTIKFLYKVLSVEFAKKIPFLEKFLKDEKN